MSAIGPELPPHLVAKRKHDETEDSEATGKTPVEGAADPLSADEPGKRRKVIGPTLPPEILDGEQPQSQDSGSEDSEDDFGPALPTSTASQEASSREEIVPDEVKVSNDKKVQRDEWMMMPPTQDDLAARMDPTKPRARAFNTSKGARGPNPVGQDSSVWHETPEQKRKRLENEIMGSTNAPTPGLSGSSKDIKKSKTSQSTVKQKRPDEPSLLEQHKKGKGVEAEDDPSKRAFDREKDMALGAHVSSSQKREMLKKASDFGSKFSGGSYL